MAVGRGFGSGSGMAGGVGGGVYSAKSAAPPPLSMPMQTVQVETSAKPVAQDKKPTGERAVLESKLHPALLKAFDCWKNSGEQCKSVQAGKIQVQIFLDGDPSTVLDQLKAIGFEITSKHSPGKALIGSLPIDKLSALARMPQVRFVSLAG